MHEEVEEDGDYFSALAKRSPDMRYNMASISNYEPMTTIEIFEHSLAQS